MCTQEMQSKLSRKLSCANKHTFKLCPRSRCDETFKTERENFPPQQQFLIVKHLLSQRDKNTPLISSETNQKQIT